LADRTSFAFIECIRRATRQSSSGLGSSAPEEVTPNPIDRVLRVKFRNRRSWVGWVHQASVCIGEDAHDVGSAADFLVEAFEHIGALEMLMVLAREPVEREGFLDGFLDPCDELGVAGRPLSDPCGEVLAGLLD
jgi:hypothetical protein